MELPSHQEAAPATSDTQKNPLPTVTTSTLATAYSPAGSTPSDAASAAFKDYLVLSTCTPDTEVPTRTAGPQTTVLRLGMPNTTTTTSAASPPRPPTSGTPPRRTRIALGVSLPILAVLTCLCLALGIRKHRHNKRRHFQSSGGEITATPVDDSQTPYLQPKGELDAHENSKLELDAEQRQYELEGDTEVHELPTDTDTRELSGAN
ncbi:MAG: hypothetical protein L6R36_009075 [Xanthoria steineri]|nr:MAG: hypothetical protein L6R36_009075 [Xanthoria steineri]